MTELLGNGLVRKYFGCGKVPPCAEDWCMNCTAQLVLRAMQEPIRKGEHYLQIFHDGDVIEGILPYDSSELIHPYHLRLPGRFQPSSENKECGHQNCTHEIIWSCGNRWTNKPQPDKFDAAVKRAFENDVIIEPGKVFAPVASERCGCWGNHDSRCACDCHDPERAIEGKLLTIRNFQSALRALSDPDMNLDRELRELVKLVRGAVCQNQ